MEIWQVELRARELGQTAWADLGAATLGLCDPDSLRVLSKSWCGIRWGDGEGKASQRGWH